MYVDEGVRNREVPGVVAGCHPTASGQIRPL